jgi:rhamnosyltransferase
LQEAVVPRWGIVIPTLNAGKLWPACLAAIGIQRQQPNRGLVIDSSSTDETTQLALEAGFEVVRISRSDFNHGGTRQWAAEYLSDCDIIVYLTQDAVLADSETLAEIVRCFDDSSVALAYGRQLPHSNATAIEAHSRIFNYGARTLKKNEAMAPQLGSKVFFCSNSFAAYRRSMLLELGGFKRDLILGEDMEFAARAIAAGYTCVYCASAPVFHSHDYSLREVFARYFDIGVFDATHSWMRQQFGSHSGEGIRYIESELAYLGRHAPLQIPRAIFQVLAKLVGYRVGRWQRILPRRIKRKISMMPSYWS